jgi:phage/plasmid-associated DNA primase
MLEPFAWLLLEHRKNMKDRVEPKAVTIATEEYKKINDIFKQFFEDMIVEDPADKEGISIDELQSEYKEYVKDNFHNKIPEDKKTVIKYFENLMGPLKRKRWIGYRIATIDDEIEIDLDERDLLE